MATAKQSVAHADRGGDEFQMMAIRTTHADVVHAAGRRDEAEAFADAERRQKKRKPDYPLLYSVQGYRYCDLLLAEGDCVAVRERAAQTLEWESRRFRCSIVLSCAGTRPRASGARAATGSLTKVSRGARRRAHCPRPLDEAVDGLRAAGKSHHYPAASHRAAFRRSVGDWDGAARDLDEVEEIAEPGPMRLYLCDMALERARLAFAKIEAFAPLNGLLDNNPRSRCVPAPTRSRS